jgi:uncharacterized protein YbjQ (UPF0145 family)
MLIVTTESVPGYEIQTVLGEVHGVKCRARNVYAEGIKFLNGVRNPRRDAVLSQSRDEAIAEMGRIAAARGANAVIGMRFDHRDVTAAWTELCAYGTAVVVVPAAQARRPAAAHVPAQSVGRAAS